VPNANTGDLLIYAIANDDSSNITSVTAPSGQNSETISDVGEGRVASASTEIRVQVFYTITTGAWTSGTISFDPNTTEQWTAAVVRIPAGEFDPDTPIGAHSSSASAGTAESSVNSPAFSAGASDGDGIVVSWIGIDVDPITGTPSGWTDISSVDRGAVDGTFSVRDAYVTDSESIASATWTIASDSWAVISFVVRPPAATTNEVFINTTGNVAAGGEATTARLSAPSGKSSGTDFVTGRRWDDENGSDSIDITTDDYTELEWILKTQSPATTGDYFEFRVYSADTPLDTYAVTAKWIIGTEQESEVKFRGGGSGGGRVNIRGGSGGGLIKFRFDQMIAKALADYKRRIIGQ
jgi:hypothetical protein